ncbi:MAG: glutamate--tRNA ligase [Dehalococcoidia bacterium]|nr:glutamate--tRNA ligase [Dehalococcoidia bacterium]
MADQVRVRYAPSPTGEPHVGNIRTALFNWLFARHMGGTFIVRIEDTDVARRVDGALDAILDALKWLGLDWDEGPEVGGKYGPYVQSQRLDLYQEAADSLLSNGYAYHCYCSPQRLQEMRQCQTDRKQPPGYDRLCREISEEKRVSRETQEVSRVVRFKMPLEGETTFNDLIRGDITFAHQAMDDFVILKSDGYPTYHLANVVDDTRMQISHVIRADEWVSSTPKHVLLYNALEYQTPIFAHLPIILGPDRSKLGKRHGAVSVLHYRDEGFLPEAVLNFLALLGWSLDDHTEIISQADLITHFSTERIGKAGAIFDLEKLTWMNGMYIRQMSNNALAQRAVKLLEETLPSEVQRPISEEYVGTIMPLVQERLKTLSEVTQLMDFFFLEDMEYSADLLIQSGMDSDGTGNALEAALQCVTDLETWSAEHLEGGLRPLAAERGVKTGQLFGTIRVAVTGRKVAPPLFETMEVLGRDRCLTRLNAAVRLLGDG